MSIFSSVPTGKHSISRFHWTPEFKVGFDFGPIYPIFCKTVLPGDTWKMSIQNFVRSMSLLSPVMHRNDIKVDAFFVPFRIIWKSAEEWHKMSDETIRRPMVYATSETAYKQFFEPGGIMDYLGFASIPFTELSSRSISPSDRKVCALPLRAYRCIYDFYFRNKEIEEAITDTYETDFYGDSDYSLTAGGNYDLEWLGLQYRSWRRDIFTSALPDPQNGSDVLIPQPDLEFSGHRITNGRRVDNIPAADGPISFGYPTSEGSTFRNLTDDDGNNIYLQSYGSINKSNSPTMRQLRYAEMLEEFEEAQARGGSAKGFKEWLKNIWNVSSSDARLDRPEYLGGYRGPIQISEVPQTSASTSTSPQGTLAGKGLSVGGTRLFGKRFFEEPGILMVTMSIVPKSSYQQGDPREWLYESPFDFPNPYFDHLGEQEVFKSEINALDSLIRGRGTFGYNVRYYEMKSIPDEVHGKLRSDLSYWHEGRIFDWANTPGLNAEFLKVKPTDVSRIFPDSETSNKLVGQFFFDIRCKRRLSYYGLPHF